MSDPLLSATIYRPHNPFPQNRRLETSESHCIVMLSGQRRSYLSNSGFSAPELLVVIIVVAILVVLAVPQLSVSVQLNRVNTLNAAVASKLAEARMQAIKRNSPVSLKIDTTTRKFWIETGGTAISGSEGYDPENQIVVLPDNGTAQATISFNSFGNLQTVPPTITISNPAVRRSRAVNISVSGKITIGPMLTIP